MDAEDVLYKLVPLLGEFGVDPRVPLASETFFLKKINEFQGSESECINYIVAQAPNWFRCLNGLPEWIQSPKWMFSEGNPMSFVGQINTPTPGGGQDSGFFLFWNPDNGDIKVVHQMY